MPDILSQILAATPAMSTQAACDPYDIASAL